MTSRVDVYLGCALATAVWLAALSAWTVLR
jgi:hypothetical protein